MEVTGNYRPGKPNLAILVSALLLLLMLAGAALLTQVRNHPISLSSKHNIAAVRGLRMAWPTGWTPVQPPGPPGPVVAGVALPGADGANDKILFLLSERIGDTYISPQYAATYLRHTAAQQLGFLGVSHDMVPAAGEMIGRPAFQIKYAVYLQKQMYFAVLRVASEPNGTAIGLLLLCREQMSPAAERVLDEVADAMELSRKSSDLATTLAALKLAAPSGNHAALGRLRGYLHEMPAVGAVEATFVPEGPDGSVQPYAINLWTSWLANRRTLQDMASTWYRRQSMQVDPPNPGGWVQHAGARIWKMTVAQRNNGTDTLVETLYLKELPDKRVIWARTTASAGADPQDIVEELVAAIQGLQRPGWTYDFAVAAAGTVLAAIAPDPVNNYYRANTGRQDFTFIDAGDKPDGTARYTTDLASDGGTWMRREQISFGSDPVRFKEERAWQLRPDLSTFHVKDLVQRGDLTRLIEFARDDAASPVSVIMKFGPSSPIQASFQTREPFLPDPAVEPAAWHVAGKPGTTALFRIVGTDPEVPESLLLTGLGRQQFEVAGRQIDAWACLLQEDTSEPSLMLFQQDGRLVGYVFESGTSLLRPDLLAATQPALSTRP